MLSSLQQEQLRETRSNIGDAGYLVVLTTDTKTNVSLYHKNLLYYLENGLELKSINYIISFKTKPFMKEFVEYNLSVRNEAKNKFENSVCKNIINFTYGKFSSSYSINTTLCDSKRKAEKYMSKDGMEDVNILNDNLSIFFMRRRKSFMNKNPLISFVILEHSKRILYEKVYALKDYFKKRLIVASCETDGIICKIACPNNTFIHDLQNLKEHFDFSGLPQDHPLFSEEQKGKGGIWRLENPLKIP